MLVASMECLRPVVSASLRTSRRAAVRWQRIPASSYLHNSARHAANPLPHPTIIAQPPPPPPTPEPSLDERVARKRKQAELLQKGRELKANPSRPSTVLQKRFWKHVHVKETPGRTNQIPSLRLCLRSLDGFQVLLDARPVRTASKQILTLPLSKPQLAMAIAVEWDQLTSAQQALKQHYVPLTSLASRAVDIEQADETGNTKIRDDIVWMVMRYLHTDTLLCWAGDSGLHEKIRNAAGETLREKQMRIAQPIIGYLATQVWPGVEIHPVLTEDSIIPAEQPEMTQLVIRGWVSGLTAFDLAALERAVLAGKSLLVAARLIVEWSQAFTDLRGKAALQDRFCIDRAAEACSLEVRWQTDMWGEVEDTHDVDREDLRRQLGSAVLLVNG
jgi:ATP synthase mitochondrial F1 complex assembly factor 2